MSIAEETIGCEDCAGRINVASAVLLRGELLCRTCAEHRAQAPSIYLPMWARLWRVFGGKSTVAQKN